MVMGGSGDGSKHLSAMVMAVDRRGSRLVGATARCGLAGRWIDHAKRVRLNGMNRENIHLESVRAPLSDGERSEPGCGVCLTWRA